MLQIIKRIEGLQSVKETIEGQSVQIAYNDWGHLTVRIIKSDREDILAVFDAAVSSKIINFIKDRVNKPVSVNITDDLPF